MPNEDRRPQRSLSGLDERGIQVAAKRAVARLPKTGAGPHRDRRGCPVEEAERRLPHMRCAGGPLQGLGRPCDRRRRGPIA
jgi:hypothetical protein